MLNYKSAIAFLFCTILLANCGQEQTNDINKLNWMLGNWQGVDSQGLRFSENWIASGTTGFTCKGSATASNGDTIYKEVLKIEKLGNELFFITTVPEQPGPVHYKIESLTDNSVMFTNRDFDFPQEIKYVLEKTGVMNVTLKGNGKEDKTKIRVEQLTFQKMN